jgi:hypothetical protein
MNYLEKIPGLRIGAQVHRIKEIKPELFFEDVKILGKYLETKYISPVDQLDPNYGRFCRIYKTNPYGSIGEIHLKNIENIERITLCLGDQQLDHMPGELIPVYQKIYNMKGLPFHMLKTGIPYLAYDYTQIQIFYKNNEFPEKEEMIVRIYKHTDELRKNGYNIEKVIFANSYSCNRINDSKIKLSGNRPSIFIIVDHTINGKLKEFIVEEGVYDHNRNYKIVNPSKFLLKITDTIGNFDVYQIPPSLLAEDIQKYAIPNGLNNYLQFETPQLKSSKNLGIYVTELNILLCRSGMAGTSFSK